MSNAEFERFRTLDSWIVRAAMPPYSDVTDFAPIRETRRASPFAGILEQSRELICDSLDEAIDGMLNQAGDALMALIKETTNREEWRLYEETREVVQKQRDSIEMQFQASYLEEFQRRCQQAQSSGPSFAEVDEAAGGLELVGEEDLEETLKFNDMAAKLRAYCDEELSALDQRVGVLLGDANLQTKDNPFAPQVICDAYKQACCSLDTELKVRRVLLKLFDDHVLDAIRAVYKDVNTLLVRNGILPKIRYNIARKAEDVANASLQAPMSTAGSGAEQAAAVPQDLFALLQGLMGRSAGVAGGPVFGGAGGVGAGGAGAPGDAAGAQGTGGGITLLQGAELLGALTRIQRGDASAVASTDLAAGIDAAATANVLHALKTSNVGAGMGQLDLLTLDIIAMLFDQLFDDPKIPNGVKGLIGRLQIPMLKVAIADKSFFSTKNHPARRLLDALGEIALRLPADFSAESPMFERLQGLLQAVVDGFRDNLDILTETREQLLALVSEEDLRVDVEARAAAKRVEEEESLALGKSIAQEEIRVRLEAQQVPRPIRDFLTQQWLKLLLLIHVKAGKQSDAWKYAVETMDQILWTIQPKHTSEEQRQLAAVVPKVVKRVTAGLRSAGIDDEVRVQFFAQLMQYQHKAISTAAPAKPTAEAQVRPLVAGEAAAPAAAPLQTTALGLMHAADTQSLDFSAPIMVKNPFGGGEVSVDSQDLDFTAEAARGARAKREASITRALDNLQMGTWFEFRDPVDQDKRRPARLIFVSPRKTRYLFAADRAGKEIIQCTRAEIGRRLRIGEAVKLDQPPEESLFDRIMQGLLGKLRGSGRIPLFAQ